LPPLCAPPSGHDLPEIFRHVVIPTEGSDLFQGCRVRL
jgi:hypothetical protein